ncbi:MAG: hypothetical protein JXJ22_05305 [Bacteroidales bacterium]|nr:hypothetical protein [Bacteroidales bacterium]
MKKIFLISLLIILFSHLYAQDDEYRTIFKGGPVKLSGMGGPFMNFSSIDNQFTHHMGGGGAVLIGDFFFGGYGLGKTNKINFKNSNEDDDLDFGHGGFWLGYNFMANKAIHPVFHTLIGWGAISKTNSITELVYDKDAIFVVLPTFEMEMNFARFFKLGIGVNYRFVGFVDLPDYSNEDFMSPGAFMSFKFGWF